MEYSFYKRGPSKPVGAKVKLMTVHTAQANLIFRIVLIKCVIIFK